MDTMRTRRAKQHKKLVEYEKKYHHRAGINLSRHSKIRVVNLLQAIRAESAYEWHKREKQNPELAQELNELFDEVMQK